MAKTIKYCIHCGRVISADAERCMYCEGYVGDRDENIAPNSLEDYSIENQKSEDFRNSYDVNQEPRNRIPSNHQYSYENIEYSKVLPIRRQLLLIIFTMGLYNVYWFYKSLKHLRDYHGEDISVGLRTLCFCFVPIVNLVVFYELLDDMKKYAQSKGLETYSSGMQILGLALGLGFWVYVNIQETFNEYWRLEEPQLPIRREFSNNEIAVLVIGGIFTSFMYFFIFMMFIGIMITAGNPYY